MPSWFADLLTRAKSTSGVDYTFEQIPPARGGTAATPLMVDDEYVIVKVRAANIVEMTRWTGRFHACVHARTKYFHDESGQAEFQNVLSSDLMKNLDPAHLDRVIMVDKEVVGPIPYRGKMSLELGLFSIKGGDMASPYLDLLSGMTGIAGSYVQQALTYAEPLRKGFDLLFGNTEQAQLEIGLDKSWDTVSTGTWLLMRAEANAGDTRDLQIDAATGTLKTRTGESFRKYPYVVLQIETATMRPDWQSPELKEAWDAIGKAAKDGDPDKAAKAADHFLTVARWSPDLVLDDARRLYNKALKKLGIDASLPRSETPGRLGIPGRSGPVSDLSEGRLGGPPPVEIRAPSGGLDTLDLYDTAGRNG